MKQLFTLAAVLIITHLSYAQIPDYLPQEGLVAWYPFNGNANDESGNENNGVVNGASLIENRQGTLNSAYNFDGIDDFIEVFHSPSLASIGNSMSLSFWVKCEDLPPVNSEYQLFMKVNGGGSITMGFQSPYFSNGRIALRAKNGINTNWIQSNTQELVLSTFLNITATINDGMSKIYVNGQLQDSNISTNTIIGSNEESLIIGWNNSFVNMNSIAFKGTLDDIAIYSRALTQAEVEAIYNEELPPVCDPCLANYMAGDINCDGVVGTEDLLLLLVGFGSILEP